MTLDFTYKSEHIVQKSTNFTKNSRREGSSRPQHAKMGRKTKKEKIALEKKLHEAFDQDDLSVWSASIDCGCSYEYALAKFDEFAVTLVEAEEENWIERQDKVRKRILEGLSVQVIEAESQITNTKKRLDKTIDIQEQLIDTMTDNVENTELGDIIKDAIGRIDLTIVLAISKQITNDLNMWKNFGNLVEKIDRQLRSERILKAELVMQYDGVEIMPPPSAVLEAEIGKSIAKRNDLFQVRGPQPEE